MQIYYLNIVNTVNETLTLFTFTLNSIYGMSVRLVFYVSVKNKRILTWPEDLIYASSLIYF